MTPPRSALIERLSVAIDGLPADRPRLVGIDGVDGAGKTMLADELAAALHATERPTLRASVDSFHRPRAQRYVRGRRSPEGYYLDSYDYPTLRSVLLGPFAAAGTVCTAVWDHVSDAPVQRHWQRVEPSAVLLFDGIFLHRPELREQWDLSIFCRVDAATSCARMATRDGAPADPRHPDNRRYVEGQDLYLDRCDPEKRATYVLDNTDLAAPYLVER